MQLRVIGILAVLAMMMAFAAPVAADAPNDCPDPATGDFADESTSPNETGSFVIDEVTVYYAVSEDGKTISFFSDADRTQPLVVEFCVKGGSAANSGVKTTLSTYTVDFLNDGGQTPQISNFVVYGVPTPPTPVAAGEPTTTPASCEAAGTLVIPATEGVTFDVEPDYTAGDSGTFEVTATANPGFVLTGESEWTLTVAEQLTGDACATAATAAAASITPPSCTAAGTLVIPANTASVTYSVSPAYTAGATGTFTVTATANAGFVLNGTSQWTLMVAPQVTGASCVTGGGTLPGNPTPPASPSSPPVRQGTLGSSVPNTAMAVSPAPVELAASLGGLLLMGSGIGFTLAWRRTR